MQWILEKSYQDSEESV